MKAILYLISLGTAFTPYLLGASTSTTERLYLSGSGLHDEVEWEFRCDEGRKCGEWTTIPVPSNWELQGFGAYNYGLDEDKSHEQGQYRYRFELPAEWRRRRVELVFEGSMTDTEVWVNGKSAGPKHQGSFYRFSYEVSHLLEFEGENLLEVQVDKQSANKSVNAAEREADYWVFGGIFRPVYLTSAPPESITEIRIDARHNGDLRLSVDVRGIESPARLAAQVVDSAGSPVGRQISIEVGPGQSIARLSTRIVNPKAWSAERPSLHTLEVQLTRDESVVHRRTEQFGFRTIDVRAGKGLFVNDKRVLLKGVNRHSFWPTSGRTLNRRLNRADAELIKSLNMNAVRTAHYPPDVDFLKACDELGIYVIDELAGWHDGYDTKVGRKLVHEMVRRDHNNPSVIFWSNGNEGGWNTKLDHLFGDLDEQDRFVLHPREVFSGIDTDHYPTFAELKSLLDPEAWKNRLWRLFGKRRLVMSTEMLHGLYDGGSGAGLDDYWRLLRASARGAGGFLWSLFDESVARTDRSGVLDSDDNHAPDGIVGPYRERGPNFSAVKATFSPIALRSSHPAGLFDGTLEIENRFSRTDLSDCMFHWKLVKLAQPDEATARTQVVASGIEPGPFLRPGGRGRWVPKLDSDLLGTDLLQVTAHDPTGLQLMAWSFAIKRPHRMARSIVTTEGPESVSLKSVENRIVVGIGDGERQFIFDAATGPLVKLSLSGRSYPIGQGPRLIPNRSDRSDRSDRPDRPSRTSVLLTAPIAGWTYRSGGSTESTGIGGSILAVGFD